MNSVTRLDDLLKFLVAKFLTKVAQIWCNYYLGYIKNIILSQNCRGYFLVTLRKIGLHLVPTSGHAGGEQKTGSVTSLNKFANGLLVSSAVQHRDKSILFGQTDLYRNRRLMRR